MMAIIANENTSINVSEIKNAKGELVARFTREYFEPALVSEVVAVEQILLDAAVKVSESL
jgi:hypothetical protein